MSIHKNLLLGYIKLHSFHVLKQARQRPDAALLDTCSVFIVFIISNAARPVFIVFIISKIENCIHVARQQAFDVSGHYLSRESSVNPHKTLHLLIHQCRASVQISGQLLNHIASSIEKDVSGFKQAQFSSIN
jgi:hypothetical protein